MHACVCYLGEQDIISPTKMVDKKYAHKTVNRMSYIPSIKKQHVFYDPYVTLLQQTQFPTIKQNSLPLK